MTSPSIIKRNKPITGHVTNNCAISHKSHDYNIVDDVIKAIIVYKSRARCALTAKISEVNPD